MTNTFATLRGARMSLTRLNKKDSKKGENLLAVSVEDYNKTGGVTAAQEVEVTSIFGRSCKIRRDQVGGCCDPSTERYWSM